MNEDKFSNEENSTAGDSLGSQSSKENKLESIKDSRKIEDFEKVDDFLEYDDTQNSNIPDNDPIAESNESLNDNSTNERPTFNRTYDKNTADDSKRNSEESGKFNGEIGI